MYCGYGWMGFLVYKANITLPCIFFFSCIYNDSLQKENLTRYNILSEPNKAEEAINKFAISLDLSMEIAIKIDTDKITYILNEIVKIYF